MDWFWEQVTLAGWIAWPILLIGAIGWCGAAAVLFVATLRPKFLRAVGLVTLGLAASCAGLGVVGLYLGRLTVDEAVSPPSVSPSTRQRIRRIGYQETRSSAWLGLMACALPLLAGITGTVAVCLRRREDATPDEGEDNPPAGAPPAPKQRSGRGLALPLGVATGTVVCVGGAFAAARAPLPGPDLDQDDTAWLLIAAVDDVEAGELEFGCRRLEEDGPGGAERTFPSPDPSKVPGYRAAVTQCVDFWIQDALKLPLDQRLERLRVLTGPGRRTLPDEEQRQRIDAEIAKLEAENVLPARREPVRIGEHLTGNRYGVGPGARVSVGKLVVSGGLPKEVILRICSQNYGRFRLCYETGLRSDPTLAGTVTVSFVIGADGNSSQVTADSQLPDKTVTQCVARAFEGLHFPQPETASVAVSYPVVLGTE
ncbi:MAG: AgmX/PglI C-terminal domain-containing protein [Deltaproteobacteria bacterium]|nr:AgmX/PglI C-terminal domain-containing protein [Deltaproteobacteria bacterium]